MKNERAIQFKPEREMIGAILEGRKTRFTIPVKGYQDSRPPRTTNVPFEDWHGREIKCPAGKVGDELWVRESWQQVWKSDQESNDDSAHIPDWDIRSKKPAWGTGENYWIYRADGEVPKSDKWGNFKWRPYMHMQKPMSRIQLRITNIRAERLQDISEEDARAEGLRFLKHGSDDVYDWTYYDYIEKQHGLASAYSSFCSLWDSINGEPRKDGVDISWSANPWVWVVEFEKV